MRLIVAGDKPQLGGDLLAGIALATQLRDLSNNSLRGWTAQAMRSGTTILYAMIRPVCR
jgi:hypothetical protein